MARGGLLRGLGVRDGFGRLSCGCGCVLSFRFELFSLWVYRTQCCLQVVFVTCLHDVALFVWILVLECVAVAALLACLAVAALLARERSISGVVRHSARHLACRITYTARDDHTLDVGLP